MRPSRSHSWICSAAGLAGSTQKVMSPYGPLDRAPATEASSTSDADEQPTARPNTASAANVWISRDMLLLREGDIQ